MSNIIFDFQYDFIKSEEYDYAVDIIEFANTDEQRRKTREKVARIFTIRFTNMSKHEAQEVIDFYNDRSGIFDNFFFLRQIYNDKLYFLSGLTRVYEGNGSQTEWLLSDNDIVKLYAPSNDSAYVTLKKVGVYNGLATVIPSASFSVANLDNKITLDSGGILPISYYIYADYHEKVTARFVNNSMKKDEVYPNVINLQFKIKELPLETIT